MPVRRTPHLARLPRITDGRGNLTFVEEFGDCPFECRRLYWLYDVPSDVVRGGHAHRDTESFIVAVSGQFDVVVDDGQWRKTFTLGSASEGLYLPGMTWRELSNFSVGAVALVMASTWYDAGDYEYDYDRFRMAAES